MFLEKDLRSQETQFNVADCVFEYIASKTRACSLKQANVWKLMLCTLVLKSSDPRFWLVQVFFMIISTNFFSPRMNKRISFLLILLSFFLKALVYNGADIDAALPEAAECGHLKIVQVRHWHCYEDNSCRFSETFCLLQHSLPKKFIIVFGTKAFSLSLRRSLPMEPMWMHHHLLPIV